MAVNTSVTIGTTTTSILPANSGREWISLQNDSAEDIYIAFGQDAVLNKGIILLANGGGVTMSAEDKEDRAVINESMNGISVSGGRNLLVIYK